MAPAGQKGRRSYERTTTSFPRSNLYDVRRYTTFKASHSLKQFCVHVYLPRAGFVTTCVLLAALLRAWEC